MVMTILFFAPLLALLALMLVSVPYMVRAHIASAEQAIEGEPGQGQDWADLMADLDKPARTYVRITDRGYNVIHLDRPRPMAAAYWAMAYAVAILMTLGQVGGTIGETGRWTPLPPGWGR